MSVPCLSCVLCRDPSLFAGIVFWWIVRSLGDPQFTMSTTQPQADREELAPGFGIAGRNPLTLHDPERGIVIDVWDRQASKAERQLTDTYRYRVEVAQNQRTEYRGVFPDRETAERKARKLTYGL